MEVVVTCQRGTSIASDEMSYRGNSGETNLRSISISVVLFAMPEPRISILSQLFAPKPLWTSNDVPDQTDRTALVTGGNRGIGREIAQVCRRFLGKCLRVALPIAQILLSKNARVYIAARNENRARKTIEELKEETGKQSIFFLKLDLADLPSVKAAVEEFTSKETKLHTLYNNALVLSRIVYMGVGDLLASEQRYHTPASRSVDQTGI